VVYSNLGQGTWYWRVLPVFPSVYEGSAAYSPVSSFSIEPAESAAEVALVVPEPVIEQPQPEPVIEEPVKISLNSPATGAQVPGLTALRQQIEFRWDYAVDPAKSRFVLSRSSDPLRGQPEVEIGNPGRTVSIDPGRLAEGTWYWTVEAQTPGGLTSAAQARQIRVLAIPLLPAPDNRQPAAGARIGIEQLRLSRNIAFSWSAVQGANAYILTLYQQTANGRQQILARPPENRTSWTLTDLSIVDRGNIIWQIEAVNQRNGVIEQGGSKGETVFTLDIPPTKPVKVEDTGILYGN
jgi:hypothetical protein